MIARKIDAMHALYGTADGQCRDCPHFVEGYYHDKKLFKCEAYGFTHSDASDWRKSYTCCGLKDLPLPDDGPVIDRLKRQRIYVEKPIEGQIAMDI